MSSFEGKVAFITGAAQGIGAITAKLLAEQGASIVISDINVEKGEQTAAEYGANALFIRHDVTREDDWKNAIAATVEHFGKLNILINVAGISVPGDIESCEFELWKRTQAVNLDSVFLGCKYGLEAIKQHGGAIVNVASSLADSPMSVHAPYGASKAGVLNLTRTVGLHCAQNRYPVRVNAVSPGAIHTGMLETYLAMEEDREAALEAYGASHPMGRVGQANEVAEAILFLASDKASFTTGSVINVDGGICAS